MNRTVWSWGSRSGGVCGGVTGLGLPAPGNGACLIDQPRYPDKRIHVHAPDMAFHCGDFKS
jgi:hypothetical protein